MDFASEHNAPDWMGRSRVEAERMGTRREFTKEFKEEAVRLVYERGNLSEVARDLDLHPSVLRRWKKQQVS